MDIQSLFVGVLNVIFSWSSLFAIVIAVSALCTIALRFIQLRYLGYAFKQVFMPEKPAAGTQKNGSDMTPMEAFINTLSTNLGNGAIAGTATAIAAGGPGAALWIMVFGVLLMAVRFAEVFLSLHFAALAPANTVLGGPMLYLRNAIGGKYLTLVYGVLCYVFSLIGGCALQTNSMTSSLVTTTQGTPFALSAYVCALLLTAFTAYILLGGSERIVAASNKIVPIKVITFFGAAIAVLAYHYQNLIPALKLIFVGAFTPQALMGGALGITVQLAIRYGMMRAIFATESGLGTSAILFGRTGSKEPVKDSIVAMLSTLISAFVCFIVALCIVASGVWNSGLNGAPLTAASFSTVFGAFGHYVVTFLSVTFGMGVMVSYAYISKESWLALTNGRFGFVYIPLYCLAAFIGSIISVETLWNFSDLPMAVMLLVNLIGVVYLLPIIVRAVAQFKK